MKVSAGQARRPRRGSAPQTRREILDAAEAIFAEQGYALARLEDVAARVRIRRASMVYHFRGKPELYAAMLEHVLADLRTALQETLASAGSAAGRIERTVEAWADQVGRRPTIARLLLREVSDSDPERLKALRGSAPVIDCWIAVVQEGQRDEGLRAVDPVQLASMLIGATVFFFSATSQLAPDRPFDATSQDHLRLHREELLRITRRLLGTRGPRRLSTR